MDTTTTKLLARVLDEPGLVDAVQKLDPVHLDALVRAVGIEDAGELLAMATADQFVHLVDESLWREGVEGETFDHDRFVTWLEVIAEGGDAALVRRLRELPEETLVLAFLGQLWVVDRDTLGIGMAGASAHEAELAEKALDASLYLELSDYTLVARRSLGWDTVIDALLALDKVDHPLVDRVLASCAAASTEAIEDGGGLYEVLTAAETIEGDARADREDRRAARGFIGIADAKAFLRDAETDRPLDAAPERDAITAAYFRELDPTAMRDAIAPSSHLRDILVEHRVVPTAPALPAGGHSQFRDALAALPPERQVERQAELAYLANVLVTAGRGHDPLDAARQAIEICGRGLQRLVGDRDPVDVLTEVSCDRLFRVGARAP